MPIYLLVREGEEAVGRPVGETRTRLVKARWGLNTRASSRERPVSDAPTTTTREFTTVCGTHVIGTCNIRMTRYLPGYWVLEVAIHLWFQTEFPVDVVECEGMLSVFQDLRQRLVHSQRLLVRVRHLPTTPVKGEVAR